MWIFADGVMLFELVETIGPAVDYPLDLPKASRTHVGVLYENKVRGRPKSLQSLLCAMRLPLHWTCLQVIASLCLLGTSSEHRLNLMTQMAPRYILYTGSPELLPGLRSK
jgi:hypothetical protein